MINGDFQLAESVRTLAVEYLELAVYGSLGRDESDPIYKAVTEFRDKGAKYSSCGDLVHWLFFRLGVRSTWVNRDENQGWKDKVNLGRIFWNCPESRPVMPHESYAPGDVLGVWNSPEGTDAHVLVVKSQVGNLVYSYDYGQPGGAVRARVLRYGMLGDRKLQRVTKFDQIILGARRRGEWVPPSTEVNPKSYRDLVLRTALEKGTLRTLGRGAHGDDVGLLQEKLGGIVTDERFGPATEKRVREFQKEAGLAVDGKVTAAMWAALR